MQRKTVVQKPDTSTLITGWTNKKVIFKALNKLSQTIWETLHRRYLFLKENKKRYLFALSLLDEAVTFNLQSFH